MFSVHSQKSSGFTLIELMVLLALLSIVTSMALPSFKQLIIKQQQLALSSEITRSLAFARAEAVLNRQKIAVCGSTDGINCSTQWQHGWRVFNMNSKQTIQVFQKKPNQLKLQWRGFQNHIVFLSNGTSPSSNGRFVICQTNQPQVSGQLILNRQGRLRSATPTENTQSSIAC